MQKWWVMIKSIRIKNKLLVLFVLLAVLSISSVSIVLYQNTTEVLERRVTQSTEQAFEQANAFISYKLESVKDVSSILFMNPELRAILNKKMNGYDLGDQIDDYNRLINLLLSAQNNREIYSVRLFVESGAIFSKENSTIFPMAIAEKEPWFTDMLTNDEGIYCRPTYEQDYRDNRGVQRIISCVRPILTEGYTGSMLGVLSIDVREESILQIINQTQITRDGQVFLADNDGRVVSGVNIGGLSRVPEHPEQEIEIRRKVEGTDWELIAHIPQHEIMAESQAWTNELFGLLVLVFILAVVLAAAFAEGITRRLRLLLQHIKKIEAENWEAQIAITSHDEIGVLQSHFNKMSHNMRELIQEKYKTEAEKRTAELRALQAQINPHFLYNTLDLIHWLGMKHRAPEVSDVAGQLAKFFRLSLSEGRDIVMLAEETEHVRTYLDIQNRRFSGRIRYTIDLEPEAAEQKLVKLVLQPLVENAILHGIQEKEDKSGHIEIRCRLIGDVLEIEVLDDGAGMEQSQLDRLNAETGAGYGARNVREKLKLYHGEGASVSYAHGPRGGTMVTLQIPKVYEDKR